ncbi:MAG TPA: pirin family protein [Thermoanaerobaculia bacterium]|nr:pirin family protein [Thermoanaerobaculia bacterium]
MIQIRRAGERGHFDHGWLDTNHTFSFADYHDPRHMGFRSLRVINEDRVAPGQGFGTHGHRDMEIVSYVLEGALAHEDSMGTGSVITPGDVQYMSAGTGVRHSEYNASDSGTTHFLQIWILPDRDGYAPRYGQKRFERADKLDRLRLVVSPDGADGSIAIRQDVKVYAAVLEAGKSASLDLAKGRHAWVQVVRGELSVNGRKLSAGDGLAASDESRLDFQAGPDETEFLAFDLA